MPCDDLNQLSLADLFEALNPSPSLAALFALTREEDLGDRGDITTACMIPSDRPGFARLIARREGIICGLRAAPALIETYGGRVEIESAVEDGACANAGDEIACLGGPLRDLLTIERPLLNLIARLSGIATLTARFVGRLDGTRARLFDTRKTKPAWRGLEKYAVRCGGGFCHRIGLHDAILVKDNHLASASLCASAPLRGDESRRDAEAQRDADGLIEQLNARLREARRKFAPRFVEVEVESLDDLRSVLACEPGLIDIILLDNMTVGQMREAVRLRDAANRTIELESSGGVTLDTIRAVAETGIDRIAVGALTHSAPWLDVAMEVIESNASQS